MPYDALLERTVPISRARFFAELADFGGVQKHLPDDAESVVLEGNVSALSARSASRAYRVS